MTPSPVGPCVPHRSSHSVPAQEPHSFHTDRLHTLIQPHTTDTLTCTLTHYTYTHTERHIHRVREREKHRAYRSIDIGNTGTQEQCSHTRRMEHVGTAQSPS